MKINLKELCKQIHSHRTSGSLIWARRESEHFITDRSFLVRFNELPREVLISLFSVFCRVAEVGETLNIYAGDEVKNKTFNFDNVYQPRFQDTKGQITPYLRDFGDKQHGRVIQFPTRTVVVNEKYMKLANDWEGVMTMGNSPLNPIYLAENNLMVLPYRTVKSEGDKVINDLLGVSGDGR